MTPERYARINELLDAALDLPEERRTAYLAEACSGDDELRSEVERMLAAEAAHGDFLSMPAISLMAPEFAPTAASAATPGKRIGRYQVLSRLGSGGHGEVWLAVDPQLSRQVAVKLLSPEYASNPAHVQRLYTEARISSGLNHPNIVTIYDTGQASGADFIAQEYVAGETLRTILRAGAMDSARALRVAVQIASALAAAHAAGVVHRDVKPENVVIRADGLVKVLDFGLARFVEEARNEWRAGNSSGAVMGTVRYMAPEQVRGGPLDARSDIFSFGVVLYEMLCGQPPFQGDSYTDILSKVLQTEPEPPSSRVRGLSTQFDRIVARCLAKNSSLRYASATELRDDLEQLSRRLESGAAVSRRRWLIGAAAGATLAAGLATWATRRSGGSAPFERMSMSLIATPGPAPDAAISADGASIAYVLQEASGQSIWIRALGTSAERRVLPPSPAALGFVTFSPDGRYIYYVQQVTAWTGTMFRLAVGGGPAEKILEHVSGSYALAPDGRIAFVRRDQQLWQESLVVANPGGGAERVVTTRQRPNYYSRSGLAWSPSGRSIMCFGGHARFYVANAFQLIEVDVEQGSERGIAAAWPQPGPIVWSSDGRTLLVSASEHSEESFQVYRVAYPSGKIQRITNDLSNYLRLTTSADFSKMLALRSEVNSDLWVMPRDVSRPAVQISSGDLHKLNSADFLSGGKIVYSALAGDALQLWIMSASGGNSRQLTSGSADHNEIAAGPDGRFILFNSEGRLWRVNADGSGARQLTEGPLDVHPTVTPDGRWVVYASFSGWTPGVGGRSMLWRVPVDGGNPVQITRDINSLPDVSPDGKYIACTYTPDASPDQAPGIAVYPFEGGEALRKFVHPPGSDDHVYWTADGHALEYVVTMGNVSNIRRQPLFGGNPVQVTDFRSQRIFFMKPSPDRRRIILSRGKESDDLVLISAAR